MDSPKYIFKTNVLYIMLWNFIYSSKRKKDIFILSNICKHNHCHAIDNLWISLVMFCIENQCSVLNIWYLSTLFWIYTVCKGSKTQEPYKKYNNNYLRVNLNLSQYLGLIVLGNVKTCFLYCCVSKRCLLLLIF